jgi:hypothetical protein
MNKKITITILADVEVEYSLKKIPYGEEITINNTSMKDFRRQIESELYSDVADSLSDVVYFNWIKNENNNPN